VLPIGSAQQWAIVLSAFLVKPLYMILSLILIVVLRRGQEQGLVLLRRALSCFLVGEIFCAANYLFFSGRSAALEIGHQAGMIGMSILLPWGLLTLMDVRVLHVTEPTHPCALAPLCRRCWKREPVTCGAPRLFVWSLPMLAVLALIPLAAPLQLVRVILPVFGTPVVYETDTTIQLLEYRLYPVLAAIFFLGAWVSLLGGASRIRRAQPLFFSGFGFMSFALLRFFLFRAFQPYLSWSDTWEELTELFTVIAIGLVLWIFRGALRLGGQAVQNVATPQ